MFGILEPICQGCLAISVVRNNIKVKVLYLDGVFVIWFIWFLDWCIRGLDWCIWYFGASMPGPSCNVRCAMVYLVFGMVYLGIWTGVFGILESVCHGCLAMSVVRNNIKVNVSLRR